jgi:FtsP/CotA-like multicopper oxidase with cupredoxin domain
MFRPVFAVFLLLASVLPSRACPWCQRYGVKETVSAGTPDPGGKFQGAIPPAAQTRHYYVAAEPVTWTWVPGGENTSKPLPLPPDLLARPTASKVRYVQYTDATFTCRALDTPRLGIVGPVLRGVVGEYLAVTFLNRAGQPLSLHPHGVRYDKDSEGAYTLPQPGLGSAVGPGATFTYVWQLDEASGPQPGEPSSKCWLYHSHCVNEEEINAGLAGFIVVTDPARARPDGTPADVDREMATLFINFDETPEDESLDPDLIDPRPPLRTPLQTYELRDAGLRPSVNGRMFGNLPGLEMRAGERVRWYLGALGEDDGMHTAHWHGARVRTADRQFVDVVSLFPGQTKVADQLADNPGDWLLHCHVSDHMMQGMFAHFIVRPADSPTPPEPFLGLESARTSLRWTQAELAVDFSAEAEAPATICLRGEARMYQGFFASRQPPTIRFAGRSVALHADGPQRAKGEGARWEVLNANGEGVVLDDELQFQLQLDGAAWREALRAAGWQQGKAGATDLPVEVQLGETRHAAALPLRLSAEGERLRGHLAE